MAEYNIYQDIAQRSGGDVYIGVVGPVRTGKSTFIKKFMDMVVIPNISDTYEAQRAVDELPQSAAGRTIMTTEPKFIPNEAVEISLGDNARLKVRMIDCVGYIVPGSLGYIEDDTPRMVNTPWFDYPISFNEAAEIGTKKVITEHSTIGLVVTTDGSITEIDREAYVEAEGRVIGELKAMGKPFIVLLNSADPSSQRAQDLRRDIADRYGVTVTCVNCAELTVSDVYSIIESVLFEFPIREINIRIPSWLNSLPTDHALKAELLSAVTEASENISRVRHAGDVCRSLSEKEFTKKADIEGMDLGAGNIEIELALPDTLFYKTLGELSGFEIPDEKRLISLMTELSQMKAEYDKVKYALEEVRETGYGIVSPTTDELTLWEPHIMKQGGRYGVKLKASAPSIHMIRADIETEVNPIVGSEKQSRELIQYLLDEFESDPKKIWESNIFGKSLYELVNEGLHNKLSKMPQESQIKLKDTLTRIINEGSGGLICIIL